MNSGTTFMPSSDAMAYFFYTQAVKTEEVKKIDTSEKQKEEQEPTDLPQYNPQPYVSLVAKGDYK